MSQSAFDRAMSIIDMPDVLSVKPAVVQATNALLGHQGTHIIQTARHKEDGWTIFLQVIDPEDGGTVIKVVVPNKVCEALYRQRQGLIDRGRRKPTPKPVFDTPEERKAYYEAARIREARRVLRVARKK